MTHPEADLAPYVDGALSGAERARIEEHLAGCPRCVRDVELARAGRSAAGALPEPQPPATIREAATAAAASAQTVQKTIDRPRWQRWGVVAAAAAAGLLALTLVLPKVGGGGSSSDKAESLPAASSSVAAPIRLELQAVDYDPGSLGQLVTDVAAERASTTSIASAPASAGQLAPKTGTAAQTTAAIDCMNTAFADPPGSLIRLVRARFQQAPAYLGFYEEGPGAGQAPDTLTIRVASVTGCTPLSTSQTRL